MGPVGDGAGILWLGAGRRPHGFVTPAVATIDAMEYQALYNKYRPQRFSEIVGQDHVTHTLAREVVDGKVAHAYLFTGPRGTGKTTTARLLAKALNCPDRGEDGEPDNICDSCLGVTAGTSLDVIELDAASHNKVEDVREIRINVGTVAAAAGAYRIYILDEAHMLSRAAGNALLKTLEEPPEHVIFVLATTEPYKLLDTIRSRSQRFDFHPVGSEQLRRHLDDISGRESFETDPTAISMVVNHAGGSVRDALSLLEQVAALGGGAVSVPIVTKALGLADPDAFSKLADAVSAQDAPGALGLVAELASRGADLRRFVADSVEFFRGVFLAQYAPNLEEVVDESGDVLTEWRRHAAEIDRADVLRAIDALGDALLELRQGREERLVIELALVRLTRPETALDAGSLASRMDRIEGRLRDIDRKGAVQSSSAASDTSAAQPSTAAHEPPVQSPAAIEDPEAPMVSSPAIEEPPETAVASETSAKPVVDASVEQGLLTDLDLEAFAAIWPALVTQVRERCGPVRHALVKEADPVGVSNGVVELAIPAHLPFHLERLRQDPDLHAQMVEIGETLLGGAVRFEFSGAVAAEPESAVEPMRTPELSELEETDAGEVDPTEMVVDVLGGEIISE